MPIIVTPITVSDDNPIAWADIKYWLRLDTNDEQTQLLDLSANAVAYAEGYTEASLYPKTLSAVYPDIMAKSEYPLLQGPIVAITSVVDGDGMTITDYTLKTIGNDSFVKINVGHSAPVTITYSAGYTALPRRLKQGVLCHIELLYRERGGGGDMTGIHRFYDPYRRSQWVG
jgi:hypothetical protein